MRWIRVGTGGWGGEGGAENGGRGRGGGVEAGTEKGGGGGEGGDWEGLGVYADDSPFSSRLLIQLRDLHFFDSC